MNIHEQIADFERELESAETGISNPDRLYELITQMHALADECLETVLSDDDDCNLTN